MLPAETRLRFVSSPEKSGLSAFCTLLGKRIEIKQITFDTRALEWVLWFVPDDKGADVLSGQVNAQGQYVRKLVTKKTPKK